MNTLPEVAATVMIEILFSGGEENALPSPRKQGLGKREGYRPCRTGEAIGSKQARAGAPRKAVRMPSVLLDATDVNGVNKS
jgi:hypothetical protein